MSNLKAFWGQIKKLSFTSLTKAPIDAKTWFDYYRNLLNRTPVSVNKSFHRFVQNYIKSHDKNCLLCETGNFEGYDSLMEMNRDINGSEVKTHVDKVKNGKAHGVDGILNEAIKASKNLILPLLGNCHFLPPGGGGGKWGGSHENISIKRGDHKKIF